MNTGLIDVLGVGLVAIGLGLIVVMLMVYRELGPFSGLGAGGRWMLMGAFGMGIFAFSLKMAVAVAIDRIPGKIVGPLIAARPALAAPSPENNGTGAEPEPGLTDHNVWQALPPVAPAPADNPTTAEKVALGKRLFFERRLSADGTLSCSSCHDLFDKAGADGRHTAVGIDGQHGPRNVPSVWNAAFQSVLFWDGRAANLEEQAKGPILNPLEMGMPSATEAVLRIAGDPAYGDEFARAFGPGQAITFDRIAAAIAAYERTLITPDTPYDRFVRGDRRALSAAQLRGMALFESLGCVNCHKGPNFSDASLLGGQAPLRLFPAGAISAESIYNLTADSGAGIRGSKPGIWRVPSLRNVALTAPYFHNGSVAKLDEAVRIMARAQLGIAVRSDADAGPIPRPAVVWSAPEKRIAAVAKRAIGDEEVEDIVAFLKALSSDSLLARSDGS
jgi:cytochrome c peroxidase